MLSLADAVMYRVMQVGSSGEVIELPQIVTGNFNPGVSQSSLITNPLNCNLNSSFLYPFTFFIYSFPFLLTAGQFYIVGASPDMLSGGAQRSIAPRGSIQMSRDTINSRSGSQGEPVSVH